MTSQIRAHTKKWGNSIGLLIPKDIVEKENIKENQDVNIIIVRDSSEAFNKTFGIGKGKLKKTAQQIKDEARKELYDH